MPRTSDPNVVFCRVLLKALQDNIREVDARIEGKLINVYSGHGAWVYKHDRQHWEFQGPNGFYWYGSADNASDARYKGWSAWIRKHLPEKFEAMENLET